MSAHPRAATEVPTPSSEPIEISDAQVLSVTSSSAKVAWHTNVPSHGHAAFGLDAPTIWAVANEENAIEHESVLTGLEPSTTYRVYVRAVDEWNRAAIAALTLTTEAMPRLSTARTDGDRIVVDDSPFFPTAVWAQCPDGFGSNIDDGINLFIGEGCAEDDSELGRRLDGRAYSLVNGERPDADGRGVIGWYYPDEWDAFLASTVRRDDLADTTATPRAGRISFLTLTNHFYSRAAPLPQGRGMYPVLFSIADVLGFDLYPLQGWCRPAFDDIFAAQRELADGTGGKPTFQWIEAAPMEHACRLRAELDPTAATVRAETWLAIAGGADGVGYFPNRWSAAIGREIKRTNREIKALAPALLAAPAAATSDDESVRVSARALNGALYVIAVNTTGTTVQTEISVEGIAGRSTTTLGGEPGSVASDDHGFANSFGPLAARVYVIPPDGW